MRFSHPLESRPLASAQAEFLPGQPRRILRRGAARRALLAVIARTSASSVEPRKGAKQSILTLRLAPALLCLSFLTAACEGVVDDVKDAAGGASARGSSDSNLRIGGGDDEGSLFIQSAPFGPEKDKTTLAATGDFNNDGAPDIIVVNQGKQSFVYLNEGFGTFPAAEADAIPFGPSKGSDSKERAVVAADFDGDGDLDIAVGLFGMHNRIYLNSFAQNGVVSFGAATMFGAPKGKTSFLDAVDFDGDGDVDIIEGNWGQVNAVCLNDGGFPFLETDERMVPFGDAKSKTNVVKLLNFGPEGVGVFVGNFGQQDAIYFASTNPPFVFPSAIDLVGGPKTKTRYADVGEVNGDGFPDVVIGYFNERNALYTGISGPECVFAGFVGPDKTKTEGIAFSDVDGDGFLDVVTLNKNQQSYAYLNSGAGFPTSNEDPNAQPFGDAKKNKFDFMALADLDRDCDADIVTAAKGGQNTIFYCGSGGPFSGADFEVEILEGGATLDPSPGNDPLAASTMYAGKGVDFRVKALRNVSKLGSMTLSVNRGDALGSGDLFSAPITFSGGVSQTFTLPPSNEGDKIGVWLESAIHPEFSIHRFAVQAGPAASALAFDCIGWREEILGPYTVDGADVPFIIEAGPGGRLLGPNDPPTPGPLVDEPASGLPGENDTYIARLFDALGSPVRFQPIIVAATTPGVISFRESGGAAELPVSPFSMTTDGDGFALFHVVYLSPGTTGVTFTSNILNCPGTPIAAPALGAGDVEFQAEPPSECPVITKVEVKFCTSNPGEANELKAEINCGLTEDGIILTYGAKYELHATTGAPLANDLKIRWCTKVGGGVVKEIVEGPVFCYTPADPDPNAPSPARIVFQAKLVKVDANGNVVGDVKSEHSADLDVREKKTIPICVHQFGPNPLVKGDWDKIRVKGMNRIYTGTGVCFSITKQDVKNHGGKEKTLKSTYKDTEKGEELIIEGTLVDCVCETDPNTGEPTENAKKLWGKKDKIVVYNGVKATFIGIALGAKKVLDDNGVKAKYEICGKWENTVGLNPSLSDTRALAHEILHILGVSHTNNVDDLIYGRNVLGGKSKIRNDHAATAYKRACLLLEGKNCE